MENLKELLDLPWKDLAQLVVDTGIAKTKSEVRRMISLKAVRLNDNFRVQDEFAKFILNEHGMFIMQKIDDQLKFDHISLLAAPN